MRQLVLLAMTMTLSAACSAQVSKDDCAKKKGKDCLAAETKKDAPLAERFPFPGEDSAKDAVPLPTAPVAAPAMAPGTSPAERFPFPAEDSKSAGNLPGGDAPSSSQPAGEGGFSSSRDHVAPEDEPAATTQDGDAPVKSAPLRDLGSRNAARDAKARQKLEENRVEDDLKVAKFYREDGNFQGAYLRYKDAVERDADVIEAHYGLAETAEKLKKLDEARAEYAAYLKLDADGDHAKAAKAALKRLGSSSAK